jgi:hypothetical protein
MQDFLEGSLVKIIGERADNQGKTNLGKRTTVRQLRKKIDKILANFDEENEVSYEDQQVLLKQNSIRILEELSPSVSRKESFDSQQVFKLNPPEREIKHFTALGSLGKLAEPAYSSSGMEESMFRNLRNIGLEFGAVSDPNDLEEIEEPTIRSSAHSVDLSASEETMFDTQNMLSLFVKKSNTSDCDPNSFNTTNNWSSLAEEKEFEDIDLDSFLKLPVSSSPKKADFKALKWGFPNLEDRRNHGKTYFA